MHACAALADSEFVITAPASVSALAAATARSAAAAATVPPEGACVSSMPRSQTTAAIRTITYVMPSRHSAHARKARCMR